MAKGLSNGPFIILLLGWVLVGRPLVGAEEVDLNLQAEPLLDARLEAAKARGGMKEERRVLFDDLASFLDARSDQWAYGHALFDRLRRTEAVDALPFVRRFLERGNPDLGENCHEPYAGLFKDATRTWLHLSCLRMGKEQRAAFALDAVMDPAAPPLHYEVIQEELLGNPTREMRARFYKFLTTHPVTMQEIAASVVKLWLCNGVENLLEEDAFAPREGEGEWELLLRSPNSLGRLAAVCILCRRQDARVFPILKEWLRSDDVSLHSEATNLVRMTVVGGHPWSGEFAELLRDRLAQCPFDVTRQDNMSERIGLFPLIYKLGKSPESAALFRKERQLLDEVNLLRRNDISEKTWTWLYDHKQVVDQALAEWEKK